ncbi:MAG: thioredoxin family protein [Candidatus Latescibacterota bacterium]|jgi:thiol-disulfide isomerase/thioredoxin
MKNKLTMGFIALALAVGIGFSMGNSVEAGNALDLNAKAPKADVKMKGVDGAWHTIQGVAGEKGTLVLFSCNACPWVKKWEDRISSIGNEYQQKGIGVIMINSNDPAKVAEDGFEEMVARTKAKAFGFPYVVDATSEVARAFGATRTPEAFLFDAKGKLVYHGAIDDNASDAKAVEVPYLKNALNAVIAGEAIPAAKTKALGCSIKFHNEDS